jgi:myosin heavy subunit
MSITITQTLPCIDYLAKIDELGKIIDDFQGMDDKLSKKIRRWEKKSVEAVLANQSDAQIATVAKERLDVLDHKILICPISGKSLRRPVMERGWTVESGVHAFCRKISTKSPLDGQEMTQTPPIHLFAQAMIHWRQGLTETPPTEEHIEENQVALPQEITGADAATYFVYQQIAQQSFLKVQMKELRGQMALMTTEAQQRTAEAEEENRRVKEEAEKRAAEHEAAILEKLDSMDKKYQDDLSTKNSKIDSMNEEHKKNIATLEQRLKDAVGTNEALAQSLKNEIKEMDLKHQTAVAKCREDIEKKTTDLQHTRSDLTTQLNAASEAHKQAQASLSETHGKEVTGLRKQIQDTGKTVNQLQDQLREERLGNLQHQTDIQQLRTALSNAQQQVNQLRAQASQSGHRDCIVM